MRKPAELYGRGTPPYFLGGHSRPRPLGGPVTPEVQTPRIPAQRPGRAAQGRASCRGATRFHGARIVAITRWKSAPLVGGLVLALMTLPTIIIASRSAITAVPPSIREAAFGLGASPVQAVTHHVLPLAMPGMLTGAILGLARALGETAPLLMIGMVAFIVEAPESPLDPSSALPVQIYLWADSPERAFAERTGAAIMVLLAFLLVMNASAVWLRSKYERRW